MPNYDSETPRSVDTTLFYDAKNRSVFGTATLSARYELLEEIGRGGMGVVYLGEHRTLKQKVAVKLDWVEENAARFLREAQLLAQVRSAHVVTVRDFEVLSTGHCLLVMDWIDGLNLESVIQQYDEQTPEERVRKWMRQVCSGMLATEKAGIIHRDLKPSNILIDADENAHIADFGLARSEQMEPLTATGTVLGTPHYMAPEQAEDPRSADVRADIYSFGATFYHALTKVSPFTGDSWFSILLNHKIQPLVSPRSRNPSLSQEINDCIERCLAKSPRDRYQSFAEIQHDLSDRPIEENQEWPDFEYPTVKKMFSHYRQHRDQLLTGESGMSSLGLTFETPSNRTLRIEFGDLSEQAVDAIVSSDDGFLSMDGGVSMKLCVAAGREYYDLAREFTPVRPGRTVITPGGRLPARFVIHGVTMGHWNHEWIRTSPDLINGILDSCFHHADSLGLTSLAFPLLGTGAGGFSKSECMDIMFRFLARKLAAGLTSVKNVKIVLYQPHLESRQ